jgi:hypothetical protein
MSSNSNKLSRMTLTKLLPPKELLRRIDSAEKVPFPLFYLRAAPETRMAEPSSGLFCETRYQDSRANQSFKSPLTIFTRGRPAAFMGKQGSAQKLAAWTRTTAKKRAR